MGGFYSGQAIKMILEAGHVEHLDRKQVQVLLSKQNRAQDQLFLKTISDPI